ncbi:MAG: discoidin domain-containing protein, partial [Culicoidibacterales bacterium]
MMDGDKATYWAPSTRDDVEKTEVEFTFDELVTLDQITYSARQNVGTDSGGFPHQFEIYGAMADDAEYTLVASGSEATATKSTIAIQFPATQFKKLKFKFVETSTKTKWAHIGEIAFYQPDALMTTMADLFTTPEKNVVNPSYADLETLAQLLIEAKAHPFAAEYVTSITDAQALLTHEAITTTTAKMQAFKHYDNAAYQALFKIPSEQIANISNNAGHYSNRVLTNAIDNDVSTYWETNKANTATWNNEVIVTFTDVVEFNRIVFGARPDKKGFATKFEVYASPTVEGETFELLATGEQNAVTGLVEAQFDSTQMKRVKFKFVGATQNWATLSELAFYQQDHVVDAMNNLFTDETKSALNEAYMNEAALTQLSQAVANHPFADQYTTALEDAWILLKRTAAEVVSAQVQAFAHFENEAYSAAFKVPSSNIATITKNAGHYSSRVIANAIDDDLNTYWETNKANTT